MGKKARNILNAIAWLSVTQPGNTRPNPRKRSLSMRSIVSSGIIRGLPLNVLIFMRRESSTFQLFITRLGDEGSTVLRPRNPYTIALECDPLPGSLCRLACRTTYRGVNFSRTFPRTAHDHHAES